MDPREIQVIVRRVLDGDTHQFGRLFDAYGRRIFNLCARTLGSREAGEDAAMETFLKAFRALGTYNPALPFENWLYRIASNHCWDILRARTSEETRAEPVERFATTLAEPSEGMLAQLLREEESSVIASALNSLPAKYRVPLVLRYYSDLSYEEIAQALKLNRATVATLIFRGKQELRRAVRRMGRKQ